MGMETPFHGDADFSGIVESKNFNRGIVELIQKVVIEVDGQDTRAAAVTEDAVVEQRSAPPPPAVPQFRFDRPFNFHIIDESKKIVLFSGLFEGLRFQKYG